MKPSLCKSQQYPCIFRECAEKVCYTCNPQEDVPYICTAHRKIVLETLADNNKIKPVFTKGKLYNFKQWRSFERVFPIYRWTIFLLMYKKLFRKYSGVFLPHINKRYLHYFNAYVTAPPSLVNSYKTCILEEEIISDDDDFSNDKITARYWNPIHSVYTRLHKDKDF